MTSKDTPIRVVAVCELGAIQQLIEATLRPPNEFELVRVLSTFENLAEGIHAANPQFILIDHELDNSSTLDIIDDLALQFPEVAVITMLQDNDPKVAQKVMMAGARGFIVEPFTQMNLLSTLRRVQELDARRVKVAPQPTSAYESTAPLKTIAVYSPRGGAGCTTLAANLALSLFEETSQRVLLFEGKMFFGHLDVMLNIHNRNTLTELIPHAKNLDEGLIKEVVVPHNLGFHVLLGPSNLQAGQGVRADDLYSVLNSMQKAYDMVVIDTGNNLSENTVTFMDAADRILLVATPELASLRDIGRFLQLSRTLGYAPEKLLVVLNRSGALGGVKDKDVEAMLNHPILAKVPEDGANVMRSINRGMPINYRYSHSASSRAIKRLAKNLLKITIKQSLAATAAPLDKTRHDALLASSRLG